MTEPHKVGQREPEKERERERERKEDKRWKKQEREGKKTSENLMHRTERIVTVGRKTALKGACSMNQKQT